VNDLKAVERLARLEASFASLEKGIEKSELKNEAAHDAILKKLDEIGSFRLKLIGGITVIVFILTTCASALLK
jgi:hypothetical protein